MRGEAMSGVVRHGRGAGDRRSPGARALLVHLARGRQDLFRDVLVQERLGGANARVGMEPPPHHIVM